MWRKIVTMVMVTAFLLVVCLPAAAHNGKITSLTKNPGDEHPWGGDHYESPGPDVEEFYAPFSGGLIGPYYFIRVALYHSWTGIQDVVMDTFKSDARIERVVINPSPTTTNIIENETR